MKTFEGDELKAIMQVLDEAEDSLSILERRGLNISTLLHRIKEGKLPTYKVMLGSHEHWLFTADEVDALRAEHAQKVGEVVVADGEHKNGTAAAEAFSVLELHEVKAVNRGLEKLRAWNLQPMDLVPSPRIAGREPTPRFFLETEGRRQVLSHLRVLVAEIRKIGEHGIKIVRFKGLGEMDGAELWDTTLDPAKRTLVQVQLDDALKADEMFRTLMGEKVEPRREFIQKHALEVKEIDYHGA